MKYLFDSNVFIEAKNRYYAFDICPGFWDWIDHVHKMEAGTVIPVHRELVDKKDELSKWMKSRSTAACFLSVDDPPTQKKFAEIAAFVQKGQYKDPAKALFLSGADPWLIAKACTMEAIVVTQEVSAPYAKRKVPIPDVCSAFGVKCLNTFDALRTLSASFEFKP